MGHEQRADAEPEVLAGSARLRLVPLTVTPRGAELLVGDSSAGQFVVLPAIARVILEAIEEGQSLTEAARRAGAVAGDEVDVVEFAQALIELGFVTHIDGQPCATVRVRLHDGGPLGERLAALARPLFSRAAWITYAVLAAACAVLLGVQPRYRPHASSVFFMHDPLASLAVLAVIGAVLAAAHEGAHWLAARVEGAPARITLSHRLYFLVAETNLTSLYALPRKRRFGALLAGLAFEVTLLAMLLAAEAAAVHGVWDPSPALTRLLAALVLARLTGIGIQFLVFLRTDIYAVLVVGLDCLQLTRTTHLTIKRTLGRLTNAEARELAAADPRDLTVVRWYRWLYLAGMIWATWFLITYMIPWMTTIIRWITASVAHTSPGQARFWESLLFAALALGPLLLPIVMIVRERVHARRATRPRTATL